MTSRLDQALVDRGMVESREKARRHILAGEVRVKGQLADKASHKVREDDRIELEAADKYVSRGGLKLEHGLSHFGLKVADMETVDIGSSTGGFTDCLLQHGAKSVVAIDVGTNQLSWKLRRDPRVRVMEQTNARNLTPAGMPAPWTGAGVATIDCSFISLVKILPAAIALVRPGGHILALLKPQFEAGKAEADQGAGVITDPAIHQRVIDEVRSFVEGCGAAEWRGVVESPLTGPAGNKEFLVLIEKKQGH